MRIRFFKKTATAFGLSALTMTSAWAAHYVVRDGDTLSAIARSVLPGRVWGARGSLKKVLALNPKLRKNPNLVLPGELIRLPDSSEVAVAPAPILENRTLASVEPKPEAPVSQTPVVVQTPPAAQTSMAVQPPTTVQVPIAAQTPAPATRMPASAGDPAPAIAQTDSGDGGEEVAHRLDFGLGYHFVTLSASDTANGTSAKLFTSSDLEFSARWSQEWSERISSFFAFGFDELDFEPSSNPAETLANTRQAPARFTLGFDLEAASWLRFETSVGYGQQLFVGTQGGTTIAVDSVFVPSVSEELTITAYAKGKTSIGLEGGGAYLAPASADGYSVHAGYAVDGGAFLRAKFGNEGQDALTLFAGYTYQNQNTSLVDQTVNDVGARLQFSMPLFGGEAKK